MKILSPDYFYATTALICAVVALQHRQLLDGRRHHRHRPDGHCREHGPVAGDHGRRGHLRRLFRRQGLAPLGYRQPGDGRRRARISTTTSASRCGPRSPRSSLAVVLFCLARQPRRLRCDRRCSASIESNIHDLALGLPAAGPRAWAWPSCAFRRSSRSSPARLPAASWPYLLNPDAGHRLRRRPGAAAPASRCSRASGRRWRPAISPTPATRRSTSS